MSVYAVIQTGGKQYKIRSEDVIDVELLDDVEKAGQEVSFNCVLFAFDGKKAFLGAPYVKDACVKASVLDFVRGEKVIAYKYKKRKNYHRKKGHRQNYMRVKIQDIALN